MKKIAFWLTIIFSIHGSAFNNQKCREYNRKLYVDGPGPFGMFTSSAQFTSSTGECAAIGAVEERQKTFIAVNYEALQKDIARGNGEYIQTLAGLFSINKERLDAFKLQLKQNYPKIFKTNELDLESTFNEIQSIAEVYNG